jgi:hypothetical protein
LDGVDDAVATVARNLRLSSRPVVHDRVFVTLRPLLIVWSRDVAETGPLI